MATIKNQQVSRASQMQPGFGDFRDKTSVKQFDDPQWQVATLEDYLRLHPSKAVLAERERCAKIAENHALRI